MVPMRSLGLAVLIVSSVGGCTLPRGAAMQSEILRNDDASNPSFAHYPINARLLPTVAHWPQGKGRTPARVWPKGAGVGAGQVIAPGDAVEISIWESGDNKLLAGMGAPSARLQPSQVSNSGTVFVPYVGPVQIAGLSPDAAREKVQDQVSLQIPAAQVQLEAVPGKANSVDLVGGVSHPMSVPLVDRSLTVLGLIAEGGGAVPLIENPQLRLIRGGKVYRTSLQTVLDNPSLDIGLRPGDKLAVEKDRRNFLALGAAGRQQIMPFPKDDLNALEAVTLVGGINPGRADPKGLLILREYPASAVRANGAGGPAQTRVIFSLDLTTTDGLFSARNFPIQSDDLVLATESPINNTRTILGLIGSSVGIANVTSNLTD